MKKQFTISFLSLLLSVFCYGQALNLPVNFENATPNYYALIDFGGNSSEIIVDPTSATNHVVKTIKTATATTWAGTTVGGTVGFATPIPFAAGSTTMSVRVWSPTVGTPIRLKVEAASNPTISVETEVLTTVASAWETLVFDFSNQASGTAALNLANSYNKASMFFNFGTTGGAAGPQTYYWDDLEFIGVPPAAVLNLPVTFENTTTNFYGLTDFEGNQSEIVVDPTSATNHVVKTIKSATAQPWAGTTVGGTVGFATPIPFAAGATSLSVKVWSPTVGTPIRLKLESASNPAISVETEALTTMASTWETLVFDFSNQATGSAALNLANSYNKPSIFFNFGTAGTTAGAQTYYWDDMEFVPAPPPPALNLPVTFENTPSGFYGLTDFEGNSSEIVVDPTSATNHVVKTIKSATAQTWAGTTVGGTVGFATPIPFAVGSTSMSVRVWSPTVGTPIRLKVEAASNPTISVETEALTTVASTWETLVFNFSNQATGTAALNLANSYNKATIFFNFGAVAGAQTYYWDDMEFASAPPPPALNLPVTFENTTSGFYGLTDFEGNSSEIVVDPTSATNHVVRTIKMATAQAWAGTTVGGTVGFANPIPFAVGATSMSVRVWSPIAGIPIRLKVEDSNSGAINVETEALTTMASTWETLVFDFSNQATGSAALNLANSYNKTSIFFNFGTAGSPSGAHTYYWDDMEFVTPPPAPAVDLPVTFENATLNYGLTDFGDNSSEIVVDPTNASNHVVKTIKMASAALWAGTTVGGTVGFANPVPFVAGSTSMSVRVWSPTAGIPIRLKVEAASNPTITVETEALTTVASTWETLVFNFSNQAAGTAALNFANSYNKASIFFNFGTTGAATGAQTYYWDDMEFVPAPPPPALNLPVTFENTTSGFYGLTDFGDNSSEIVVDPTNVTNHVVKTIKMASAALWAGTTVGGTVGFATPIPFAAGSTSMSVKVWSPTIGTPIRLKVENAGNGGISVETEALTTVASAWETLVFDFSNQASGAALNLANSYNKASIFFNFGTTGAAAGAQTYYWDDMIFVTPPPAPVLDLPVTFENATMNYGLTDFGENLSEIVVDPTNASNHVVKTIKTATAALWAGTTVGGTVGFANPVPFTDGKTSMSVRVWSPLAGIPIRLKVEVASNPAITVETEALTTVVSTWETLVFDFGNQVSGTAALNLANSYNKASIFFNFGITGSQAGAQTYYWDDMEFVAAPPVPVLNLPVTFENANLDYGLTDFGENSSEIVVDPISATNHVVKTIKTANAALWAGTTVGGTVGFATPIPFAEGATSMSLRVWSPTVGTPIRLKVEDSNNGTIAVEAEALTTVASDWETLVFNFSNQVAGTASLNLANSYNKASVFFNFGITGSQAGAQTYYWDDMCFGVAAKKLTAKLFLESLYDIPSGLMKQAMDVVQTPKYGTGIADQVTVILHNATTPFDIVHTFSDVNLNTDGTLSISTVPGNINSSYYVVIKNRNHIETWSSIPISFWGSSVAYDFTDSNSKAYGENMKKLEPGIYGIYAGDTNHDGIINTSDLTQIENSSLGFLSGYIDTDVNGDGMVDALDLIMTDNNAANFVLSKKP